MKEVNRQVQTVLLDKVPVELFKILKFHGLAGSGAHAKSLIDEGLVLVNGTIEMRRRRKIQDNDLVQVGDVTLRMTVSNG